MATPLSPARIQDFLSRYNVYPAMIGRYGIVVNDSGAFVDVYQLASSANGMGFLDVTSQASDLGLTDMAPGEIRQLEPVMGTPAEVGIFDVLAQVPSNIVYDPSLLQQGAQSAGEAVSSLTNKVAGAANSAVQGVERAAQGAEDALAGLLKGFQDEATRAEYIIGAVLVGILVIVGIAAARTKGVTLPGLNVRA
jgi:hypothetical protein